jgi:hypothetical protein
MASRPKTRRVRFLVDVSGGWSKGAEVDLPVADAKKWADGERAEYVEAVEG